MGMSTKTIKIVTGAMLALWAISPVAAAENEKTLNYESFDPLVDVCDLIQKHYVTETESSKLVAGAINGMLHQLDPYSEFIPADELEDFQKQTSGSYEGIGVVIDIKDGYLTAVSAFEESPAYRAGILPGDIFLEVNGQSTKGWSATRAIHELTGPAGSSVKLRVLHSDGREETLIVLRQKIVVPTIRGWRRNTIDGGWDYLLDAENSIVYIRLTQFNPETLQEMDRVVEPLLEMPIKAMILDLRSNPGGIMSTAVEIVDRFIDQGTIVTTRGAHSPPEAQKAHAAGTWPRFHLVVMIDQGSASASEIVAGSLQDNNRAVIVGKRSWGKGSVQRIFKLPDSGASLKLTTDYYYLPKGRCLHRRPDSDTWGVDPDVDQGLDAEKMPLLRKLMDKLTISPLAQARNGKSEKAESPAPVDKAEVDRQQRKTQAGELLELDDQLDQAFKQCKGLLRTRATLQSISESLGQ
jgi:carboxyl-terminal processing protease